MIRQSLIFTTVIGASIASASAAETVTCATDPQTRANFISGQMIRSLDRGRDGLRREEWMVIMMRDAEIASERLTVICAANPEISLASALGSLASPIPPIASSAK